MFFICMSVCFCFFFFFKQKTAYEMRISDWSSDVCSSDLANSQFFITLAPARFLDRQYTVWGRVIEGMENVDAIKKAPPGDQSGTVRQPDKIISLKVEADVK